MPEFFLLSLVIYLNERTILTYVQVRNKVQKKLFVTSYRGINVQHSDKIMKLVSKICEKTSYEVIYVVIDNRR